MKLILHILFNFTHFIRYYWYVDQNVIERTMPSVLFPLRPCTSRANNINWYLAINSDILVWMVKSNVDEGPVHFAGNGGKPCWEPNEHVTLRNACWSSEAACWLSCRERKKKVYYRKHTNICIWLRDNVSIFGY
jgi:hypothetical protein